MPRRPEDVPEDLALPLAANAFDDYHANLPNLLLVVAALPWVARASAEQLYMPAAWIEATRAPWKPERTIRLLRGYTTMIREPAPIEPREGPSRQGPCPCGSGKKYKRCCGE